MGTRIAHKKAKDLFSNLSDSDNMSSDIDDTSSDEGLYDESKDDLPKTDMFVKPKVSKSASIKWREGKERSRSTSAQRLKGNLKDDEHDPETCRASFHY